MTLLTIARAVVAAPAAVLIPRAVVAAISIVWAVPILSGVMRVVDTPSTAHGIGTEIIEEHK